MISWDQVGDRLYENGLDRGVLYGFGGSGVAWNGLTSVTENPTKTSTEIFYDGQKIANPVQAGSFSGTLKAYTYPDEFLEHDGVYNLTPGVFVTDQTPKPFCLSYRTHYGNDTDGDSVGYKIHVIYNVIATPSTVAHNSRSKDPSLIHFEWSLTAVPEEYRGIRPTSHIIFDSRTLEPELLSEIETILYGDSETEALLPSFEELMEYTTTLIKISDNGDGTWTASTRRSSIMSVDVSGEFEINEANAEYLDPDTYLLTDTLFYTT